MAEKKTVPKEASPAFPVETLIARAKDALGVEKEVAAGALYGVTGSITKEEAKKRIESFLNKEAE
jgi:hypothetical protein